MLSYILIFVNTNLVQYSDCTKLYKAFGLVYTNAYTYNLRNTEVWLMAKNLDAYTVTVFQAAYPEFSHMFHMSLPEPRRGGRKAKVGSKSAATSVPAAEPAGDDDEGEVATSRTTSASLPDKDASTSNISTPLIKGSRKYVYVMLCSGIKA